MGLALAIRFVNRWASAADFGGDGSELMDLWVGESREEVFVEVLLVATAGGVEGLDPVLGDGNPDDPTVGRIGFSHNESFGFEAANNSRNSALAEWRATAQLR
jgi:hypothetical protein